MTDSPDRFPWEHDDSLLGPAVPQEDAAPADDALPEPLSPFLGGDAPVSTNSHPAFSTEDDAAGGAEEIPWLEDLQPEPTEAAFDGPPAMPGASEPELPTMDAFVASSDGEAMPAGEENPFDSPFSGMDVPSAAATDAEPAATSEAVFAPGADRADDAPAEADLHTDAVASAASDVADRLERIARALRSGDPGRLLTSASDPLEMLVVGYVLGCSGNGRSGR